MPPGHGWLLSGRVSSLYGSLAGRRAGEYHFSVDQEPCSSVSFFAAGVVCCLPTCAKVARVFQHGVVPSGSALSCFVGFVGLRGISS